MDTALIPLQKVRRFEVERMPEMRQPSIAIAFEDTDGRQAVYVISDASTYTLIRKMTDVMFAVEE